MKKLCISNAKTKLCNLSTNDDMNRSIGAATIGIAMSLSRMRSKSENVTAGEDFISARSFPMSASSDLPF